MKYVSLLCCIDPSINTSNITEFTIYGLLNPIVTILNVKIIPGDGQVKAFVQVENQTDAKILIQQAHGKISNCGNIKLYLSSKKFIDFVKTINNIVTERRGIEGFFLNEDKDGLGIISTKDTKSTSNANTISNLKLLTIKQNLVSRQHLASKKINGHRKRYFSSNSSTALVIIGSFSSITIEDICLFISKIRKPRRAIEYFCLKDIKFKYLIEFSCAEDCQKVHNFVANNAVLGKKFSIDFFPDHKRITSLLD